MFTVFGNDGFKDVFVVEEGVVIVHLVRIAAVKISDVADDGKDERQYSCRSSDEIETPLTREGYALQSQS